ncbi:kinesin-associated protein 3-like isoform X2 [Clavelina lepadiformis]|uniref:kinesin-associated protein 3-like isoform X2 n=1 Tax=Clavelina lepadiformis TaxID=159417 RepID=UPI0040433E33
MFYDESNPPEMMMHSEDARYLKRKVKGGNIDVHPSEKAIIVNYEVEATILGELGDPMLGEKKESQKVIRLRSLNEKTDISALAREVVERCKLIHISKLPEVEQLLYYLQNRKETAKGPQEKSVKSKKSAQGLLDPAPDCLSDSNLIDNEIPSVNNIDDYVELLYEDVPSKIKASALLLRLTRNPDNLEELNHHATVLGALTRVLREDWRKSVELSTNIMYIFFCFSAYTQFHSVIAHHKIGALCMTIAEHELARHNSWREDVEKRKQEIANQPDNDQMIKDYEKANKKYQGLVRKQDQLLRVAFYLLLNLAEDTRVEAKMKNKGIVGLLVKALETRRNPDLILLVISFLKKLSIFLENKNEMTNQDIVAKVAPYVACDNSELSSLAVRLLLNLSFDKNLRHKMIDLGLLPRIASLLGDECNQAATVCLLYHLSVEDKVRSLFSYTDCIPQLLDIVFNFPAGPVSIEVAALCINIATNKRNTQIICEWGDGKGIKFLVRRAFKFKDPLILKMIRNMSQHAGPIKSLFIEHAGAFAKAIKIEKDEDFVIECLGTLGNLNHPNLNYEAILERYDLMAFIQRILKPNQAEDDLVLECIVLLGTVALDGNCAAMLSKSGIIQVLIDLLNAKQEDDELVLQIAYVFYQMIWHEETRIVIVSKTQVPAYLIDLMHDRNTEIRKVCDNTLDIIMEYDVEWAKRIQLEKFRWHNSQWIDMVESQQQNDVDDDDIYDDVLTPYLRDDGLLLYEPNFDEDVLMENGLKPEFIDEEALRNGLGPAHEFPPGYEPYMQEFNPSDPRFLMHSDPDVNSYYNSQTFARPSSPDFIQYHDGY